MAIIPPALRPGDTIGIVAPASPMVPERLSKGVEYLKARGYRVVVGAHIHRRWGYLAGKDEERADDLLRMFADPEVKAILAARGGYGAARILDLLDYELIASHPKIVVGYSDLTTLQMALWKHTGLVTYSGPMVAIEMGRGIHPFTEDCFWRAVEAPGLFGSLPLPPQYPVRTLRPGVARGRLLGGCLSLLPTLLGTPYQPDFRGAILVLEDVGEEPYRVDRCLAHLRQAGVLEAVAGVVLGQFIDCVPLSKETPSFTVDEVLEDYFRKLDVPVLAAFPYGHGEVKVTLPLGIEAELDADRGELRLLEPSVRAGDDLPA
ncbi:MAG: LD-carboxypeptidase [candidate division KSB1 bacterium]|nr:LD-carboxypeptidase [candidate division KSB1 bacterium]